ncbi:MAG TPA: ABC transporter substrate-binding protein [Acidobacteriaceae bacterium]|jgi:ABC-type transport system substrate-binding protein|nr:ABC transporter substrate-binding protein [Acidobacteriaceae bacterium]
MLRRSAISWVVVCLALSAGARTRPHYGGTLRVETQGDPWQMPDGLARKLVLDSLTSLDDAGSAQPALAVHWAAENNAHRWDFALRTGVRFSDGTPLTADAAVSALEQDCGHSAVACPWNALHAVGSEIILTTDSAMPDLPELLAESEFAIARPGDGGVVEGTGPFRVVGFANGALTLAANDDCWQGRPFLDAIEIYPHRTISDQWLDLSVGKADVVEVPPEMLHAAQQQRLSVLVSRPVDLLALALTPQGPLAEQTMRQSIALAVDRASLSNVIFQKQGEISASLLPASLSGYSFLFSAERDLDRAHTLRGGANVPPLALAVDEPGPSLQLAASRLALNLHEAGLNAFVVAGSQQPALLALRRVHLEEASPRAALDEMLARFGQNSTVSGSDSASLYQSEGAFLAKATVVPLLWLPRAWASGERVRDLRLAPDGLPMLANASLEGAQ